MCIMRTFITALALLSALGFGEKGEIHNINNTLVPIQSEPDTDGINDEIICPSTHECQSIRCGTAATNKSCGCDAACEYYGDCCYDYSSSCGGGDAFQFIQSTIDPNLLQCVTGDIKFGDYYVIGLCRDENSVYIDKCEHPTAGDVLLAIIVSDADYNIYRNVYCALCNGVHISEVTAWEAKLYCLDTCNSNMTHIPPIGESVAGGFVEFSPPLGVSDTRRGCNSMAKGGCRDNYVNETVVHACEMQYKGLVYVGKIVYMNPHCAICNDDDDYNCESSAPNNDQMGSGLPSGDEERVLTPLTIIVDFSSQSSISVVSSDGSYAIEGVDCAAGEVFDPFTSKCLQLACKAGFTLQGSKCIASPTSSGCDSSGINVREETFCSCKLQEQSIHIEYQYENGVQDFLFVDELMENLDVLRVNYSKQFPEHSNLSIIEISIIKSHCQLAYNISNLVFGGINSTNATELSLVTFTQNCSTGALPNKVDCAHANFLSTDEKFVNTTLIPDDGYVLKIVHKFENKSYTCSSSSISTCEVCPHSPLNASAFVDLGNGTLVHELTGQIFEENEYVFSNSSRVLVCSFLNQSGSKIVKIQFFTYSGVLLYISVVGTILSLIGLFITIIVRVIFTELRTLSGKIIINISISLFCALLLTLVQGNFTEWETFCNIIAAALHYLWLVCFLWMNAIAFELSRTFLVFRASPRSKHSQNKSFIKYFMYSWGIPAVYVGIIIGLNYCECTGLNVMYGDDSVCWIRDAVASLYVFGIPLAVILLPNLILFVATITGIREARQSTAVVTSNKSKHKQITDEMVIYIRISTVMGLSWAIGFLGSFIDHEVLWYLFAVLNSLQGFFIFVAFNITHSTKKILTSRKKQHTSLALRTHITTASTVSKSADSKTSNTTCM